MITEAINGSKKKRRRQRPIGAKDPNAMHLAGMDLRYWLGEVPQAEGRGW